MFLFTVTEVFLCNYAQEEGEGAQPSYTQGGSAPRSLYFPFCIAFFLEKGYPFIYMTCSFKLETPFTLYSRPIASLFVDKLAMNV